MEALTGNTLDILEYLEYEGYQPVWILNLGSLSEETRIIGRRLGVSHRIGQAMCFWVSPPSGIPIIRTTIQVIIQDELCCKEIQDHLASFNRGIQEKMGSLDESRTSDELCLYLEDEDNSHIDNEPFEPDACIPDVDNFNANTYDELLLAEPLLPEKILSLKAK